MAQALIRIFLLHSSLAGLVVFAERLNPIPSRTRPLNFPAPMVLSLKAWKSRSLPGRPRTRDLLSTMTACETAASNGGRFVFESCPPKTASNPRSIRGSFLRNQDVRKAITRTRAELASETLRLLPDQTFPSHGHKPVAATVGFLVVSWQVHEIGAFAPFPSRSAVAT